jgi:hemerythrin-like domain-containing protein
MSTDASKLLDELRTDHRNLTVLIDLLDAEIDRLKALEDPDYELLRDVMLYMTGYPDVVHHRKEDWVYARMVAVRPAMQRDLIRIERDHAELAKLGTKLLNDIEAIESGTVMRRFDVVEDARNYVSRQRDHMRWEDEKLFPLVDSLQGELDLSEVASHVATTPDPVFGPTVDSGFRSLFDAISKDRVSGS